jgi:hypothetical protein
MNWATGYKTTTTVIKNGGGQLSSSNKTQLIDHLKTGEPAALYFSSSIPGGSKWTSSITGLHY